MGIWPIYRPQEVLLKQLNQYFPPPPFFSSPHALTKFFVTAPPQQHFPSSDSVLFNNKSFHQNLHFLDVLYMHLLFPIFFSQQNFVKKKTFLPTPHSKMKNKHP